MLRQQIFLALHCLVLHHTSVARGWHLPILRRYQQHRIIHRKFGSTKTDSQRHRFEKTLGLSKHSESLSVSSLGSLVVLIPAYNEEERITSTLESYVTYFRSSDFNCDVEILVVDDGSIDGTADVVRQFFPHQQSNHTTVPVRCVSLDNNQGKGAALARGIQELVSARDKEAINQNTLVLTMDADGSGDLIYLPTMLETLYSLLNPTIPDNRSQTPNQDSLALVTGNRNYNIWSTRGILRWGFQTCVQLLMMGDTLPVQDTQCGYKLMTLSTAAILFPDLNLRGWSHDVEILLRAKRCNIPVQDVVIEWEDKAGSKVVESGVAKVSLQMLLDVIRLRWEYSVTGKWKL